MEIDFEKLESYLKGEFAGRIFDRDKILPVLKAFESKGDIDKNVLKLIEANNSLNYYIYYNSSSKVIFDFQILASKNLLLVEVIKNAPQDWIEVQDFCSYASELMPIEKIMVSNKFEAETPISLAETEAA